VRLPANKTQKIFEAMKRSQRERFIASNEKLVQTQVNKIPF
jgi:hypothetical protein